MTKNCNKYKTKGYDEVIYFNENEKLSGRSNHKYLSSELKDKLYYTVR
ncbi:MAG: hypothetical protein U5K00_02705 [Melioribacteraceae bacterium]|nr:hypothetical protein [Melioribacteraceae bacterium]